MYNVDFNKLSDWLMPPSLRTLSLRSWLRVLVSPISVLHTAFTGNRNQNLYRLNTTPQVCYLKKALNDTFDSSGRGITISNAQRQEPLILFTRAEWASISDNEKKYIYTRTEDEPLDVYTRLEYSVGGGFVVNVPFSLSSEQYYLTLSLVNSYKLAGRSFRIQINL